MAIRSITNKVSGKGKQDTSTKKAFKKQLKPLLKREHEEIEGPEEEATQQGWPKRFGAVMAAINDGGGADGIGFIPPDMLTEMLIDFWRHARLRKWRSRTPLSYPGEDHTGIIEAIEELDGLFGTHWIERMEEEGVIEDGHCLC